MKYYAVVVGRIPQIYDNWKEASDQVKGYRGAIYKSFSTKKQAEEYMKSSQQHNTSQQDEEEEIPRWIVYTDGSYDPRSKRAGYGFLILDMNDIQDGLPMMYAFAGRVAGKASNNTGELNGIFNAIKMLDENDEGQSDTIIYTDSQYSIGAITTPLTSKSKNRELIQQVKDVMRPNIILKWVKAHSDETYNNIADLLADRGRLSNHYNVFQIYNL